MSRVEKPFIIHLHTLEVTHKAHFAFALLFPLLKSFVDKSEQCVLFPHLMQSLSACELSSLLLSLVTSSQMSEMHWDSELGTVHELSLLGRVLVEPP